MIKSSRNPDVINGPGIIGIKVMGRKFRIIIIAVIILAAAVLTAGLALQLYTCNK